MDVHYREITIKIFQNYKEWNYYVDNVIHSEYVHMRHMIIMYMQFMYNVLTVASHDHCVYYYVHVNCSWRSFKCSWMMGG